jgi:thiamine-monophosphate kinase
MAEFELIADIRRRCGIAPPVTIGIGDDAAVLQHTAATTEVVTTDMLMEGVDFLVDEVAPELIGRKCLAVNLSDIAAMGAKPTAAFVSVALPIALGRPFADRFFAGLLDYAAAESVTIAGGDTNTWRGPLVCSITLLGEPVGGRPVLRAGAQPGDWLCVTGACGGSLAGRHLTFTPRLQEVAELVQRVTVRSMLDISDGLAADLHHLLKESGVGAIVDAAAIPIHADVALLPPIKTPLQRALSDGEDFELLFTIAAEDGPGLLQSWRHATPITRIGVITSSKGCWLQTATGQEPLLPLGWTHALDGSHGDGAR